MSISFSRPFRYWLRRTRRYYVLFRILFASQPRRVLHLLLSAVLVSLWLLFNGLHAKKRIATTALFNPIISPRISKEFALKELSVAEEAICSREVLEDEVEKLTLCGRFPRGQKKIVGLLEAHNVEASIAFFLKSLYSVVDSVVVLDDHSTDLSRIKILKYAIHPSNHAPVEVLLNKTGKWIRDELADRKLLLRAGREVGGTHFVLLDYDEFFSRNCIASGLLRRSILSLEPGESLYLPWIELWRSFHFHRVLPTDVDMNFLTRRQIIIFADDSSSDYTKENSQARIIGSNSRRITLHVLRCPRSICPKPSKYGGPGKDIGYTRNVKRLPHCKVIETRFVNMQNVLLKSAWYEALGRSVGADDGETSGKMITSLFPKYDVKNGSHKTVRLSRVPKEWISGLESAISLAFNQVELWRATDLLRWRREGILNNIEGLSALSRIQFGELAVIEKNSFLGFRRFSIPQKKMGRLVLVREPSQYGLLSKYLKFLGFRESQLKLSQRKWRLKIDDDTSNEVHNMGLARELRSDLHIAQGTRGVFVVISQFSDRFQESLLLELANSFSDLDVIYFSAKFPASGGHKVDSVFAENMERYVDIGSNMRVIGVPLQNLGSFAVLRWLQKRLLSVSLDADPHPVTSLEILSFAERLHREGPPKSPELFDFRLVKIANVIFSLNVGRCGSKYLAEILNSTADIATALHEPACPNNACTSGGALRMQDLSRKLSFKNRSRVKLPMIRSSLSETIRTGEHMLVSSTSVDCRYIRRYGGPESVEASDGLQPVLEIRNGECSVHKAKEITYAETNPNFKSWIFDIVLDHFPKTGYHVKIVVIRKYIAAVLKSLYETGYFSKRNGYNWMETAASVNSVFQAPHLRYERSLDAFSKLLSYIVASEATFEDIQKRYSHGGMNNDYGTDFLDIRSEELYTYEGTMRLLRRLKLKPSAITTRLAGLRADKYLNGQTKRKLLTTNLGECERRVDGFVRAFGTGSKREEVSRLLRKWEKIENYDYGSYG